MQPRRLEGAKQGREENQLELFLRDSLRVIAPSWFVL
jgi:hypothetical protein